MTKKLLFSAFIAMVSTSALADTNKNVVGLDKSPIKMTDAEMSSVVAGRSGFSYSGYLYVYNSQNTETYIGDITASNNNRNYYNYNSQIYIAP